ncbi:unnamed protein product [Macrosiphum euphorbiae]|uniref:Uncharacterized protein n=1 Tax=Macrosiphum euphorbiae TaxID=13131 RepID=A0AAV0XCH3_9HEMI|nr:unnamed protein product [Macrosiphum euphorbiae]
MLRLRLRTKEPWASAEEEGFEFHPRHTVDSGGGGGVGVPMLTGWWDFDVQGPPSVQQSTGEVVHAGCMSSGFVLRYTRLFGRNKGSLRVYFRAVLACIIKLYAASRELKDSGSGKF